MKGLATKAGRSLAFFGGNCSRPVAVGRDSRRRARRRTDHFTTGTTSPPLASGTDPPRKSRRPSAN